MAQAKEKTIKATINPASIWQPKGRGFGMGCLAKDGVLLHFTGQVAWDCEENIVGLGDVAEQARQCFRNIQSVLSEAGGTLDHLVSVTTYYTQPLQLIEIQKVRREFLAAKSPPASTSVMVAGLGHPDFLVELQPVAVIPRELVKWPNHT